MSLVIILISDIILSFWQVMRFHGSPLDKEQMKHQLRRAFLPKYQPPGGIPEDERIDVVITTYT